MKQAEWISRKFPRIDKPGLFPNILERLMGTPIRLNEKLRNIDDYQAEIKPDGKWSVKEEIGHLADLEPLWLTRVQELLNGQKFLSEADLSNQKTHEANHNQYKLQDLIRQFTKEREKLLIAFYRFQDKNINHIALHPRLKTPMNALDLAFFIAEHDDHHLVHITSLQKLSIP